MKFLYSLTGANHPVIKEFAIDPTANVRAGEVILRDPNGVIGDGTIGYTMGVCAEDHTGENDILNERNDGDKIRIDITRGGVYEVDAFVATANSQSTQNTLVTTWSYLNNSLSDGRMVLVKKGDGSTNTDEIGTIRTIKGDTIANNKCTFTLSDGGAICEGDTYAILPLHGFSGAIASDRASFVPTGNMGTGARVIRCNEKTLKVEVEIRNKIFD